jgi:DNA polymerase I-like protein with 3'-5' exonuclease and polymerase domains
MDFTYISAENQNEGNYKLISDLNKSSIIGFDIETTGLDPFFLTVLLIQIWVDSNTYVIDARNVNQEILKYILSLIANSHKIVVGHNLKFDAKVIKYKYGIEFNTLHDTMIVEKLLYNGIGDLYPSLVDLVKKYCNVELDKSERSSFIDYTGSITQEQIDYSAKDIKYLLDIYKAQVYLVDQAKMLDVYNLEMKLEPVVIDMELNGIGLNIDLWDKLATKASLDSGEINEGLVEDAITEILNSLPEDVAILTVFEALKIKVPTKREQKALTDVRARDSIRLLKERLNLASPKQLQAVLDFLGIEVKDTNKKTLKKLIKTPFLEKLFELKEKRKKSSSFGENLLEKIHPITKKIHQDLDQLGTASGRFSSKAPNLQQIPHGTEYRECFIADKGCKFIVSDYAQQELRLLASISQEPLMVEAFINGEDPHAKTASLIFSKPLVSIDKNERQTGKTLNFATVYGTTERGLNYNFGFELDYAKDLLEKFWKGYPTLSDFHNECKKLILLNKRSKTPLGRIRYFKYKIPKDIENDSYEIRKFKSKWEFSIQRQGFNHIIQGCGADVTKQALINIYYNNPFGTKLKIILCTHDEILTQVDESIATEALKFQEKCMLEAEQPYLYDIPALVESKISTFWEK